MGKTDTSERGLERLICQALTGQTCEPAAAAGIQEPDPAYGGVGWICGKPASPNLWSLSGEDRTDVDYRIIPRSWR